MKIKIIASLPRPGRSPILNAIGNVYEVIARDKDDTDEPDRHSIDLGGTDGIVVINPGEYEVVHELSKCCGATVRVEGKTTQYYVCQKCNEACDAIPTTLAQPKKAGKLTPMNKTPAEISIRKAAKLLEKARRELQVAQPFKGDNMPSAAITKIASVQVDLATILDLFKP